MQAVSFWRPVAHRTSTPKTTQRPWATYSLMLGILLAMTVEILVELQGANFVAFMHTWGLVSADFSWTNPLTWVPLVTFNFLHSGARHFAGNTIMMLFAGAAVEKHAGRRATLFIWLVGGIAGGLAHLLVFPDATIALVGASGAIAAMLGAAVVIGWRWALPVRLWCGRRVLFSIPLPVVTGIWLAFQIYGFIRFAVLNPQASGVATWVHLAGFAFGALAALALSYWKQRSPGLTPAPVASAGD